MSLKKLVEEITKPFLEEGINDPGILKAVFLAGGPGSGKGFVSQGLFGIPKKVNVSAYGMKLVNQDKELTRMLKKYGFGTDLDDMPEELFRQLTDPDYEDYSGLRSRAKELTKARKKMYMDGRLGLIIDGTGHKYGSIKKKKKELEEIGYDCFMVFVHTDLEVAQKRNMERPRKLNPELVEDSWKDVQKNKISFQGLFGNENFLMVDNSKTLGEEAAQKKFDMLMKKGINKFIKKPIKNYRGKRWIEKQKIMKEDINIPIKVGDTILVGKFKNKKMKVKSIGKDKHGMPTINGRKAATFRIHSRVNIFDEEGIVGGDGVIQGSPKRKKINKNKTNSMSGYKRVNEAPSKIKKVIGIYPGRFQPFGPHHLKTYKWLESKVDEVYITTSNIKKPPRHPMNFKEKVQHMIKMGVPKNRIVQEKMPYVANNLLKKYDPETTAVIYIFGKKDAGRLIGGKKKSGGLTYYQDYKKNKGNLKGHKEHGYIMTAPHQSVSVAGKEVSGTVMRQLLGSSEFDDKKRQKLFKKAFGYYDKNVYNMMTNKFKKLFEFYNHLFENSNLNTAGEVDDGPSMFSSLSAYEKRAAIEAGRLGWELSDMLVDFDSYKSQYRDYRKDTDYPKGPVDSVSFGPAGINEPSAQNLSDYVGTELWNRWLDHIDMILSNQDYEYVDDLANTRKSVVKHSRDTAKQMDAEEPEQTPERVGDEQHDELSIVKEVKSLAEVSKKVKIWKQRLMRRGIKIRYSREEAEKDLVKKYGGKGHIAAKKFGFRKAYYAVPTVGSNKPGEKPKLVINKPEMEKLHKDKEIDKGRLKVVYQEILNSKKSRNGKELLLMGGAYGHMAHPFDDKDLTFGDLKKIITMGLGGQLNREDGVTEKLDGQNLMVSWRDGRLIVARNKGHIKNSGKSALSVKGVQSKFKGRGKIRDAFVFAVRDLQKAIGSLSKKQQVKIFGNGNKWMNLEVLWPASENVINYDVTQIIFHGALEYDDSARVVGQAKDSARMLAGMIKQINQNIQKKYKIGKPNFLNVPKHQDFGKMKDKFLGQLKKLQSTYGLKDNDTLALYHQHYWQEWIMNGAKQTDNPKLTNDILIKLTKRWAFFDKSYTIPMIKKDFKDYPKFLDWVLTTDKMDHSKMVKDNMKPFEELFFGVGAEIMKNVEGWLAVNPDKSIQSIRAKVKAAISTIRSGGDLNKLSKLKVQLDRLNAIGGLDAIIPSEGIVFKYNGKTYKFTGAFAPVNQITGMMTFGR
tara:strand:+ start:18902 stop:22612 length:3711 start_codon:yes stop_codon:yes gene_type:complete